MQPCTALLTCPVCDEHLLESDRSLRCAHGHTFDRARQGYVDLLPVGYGRSRIRGDTAEMLHARRRVLARGYYEPLSRKINAYGAQHLSRLQRATEGSHRRNAVVDVGCGDGYYLGRLMQAAKRASADGDICFFGLDVSKHAVRLASRGHPRATFLINDVKHRLCFADQSVDLLLNIFAPKNPGEFHRVIHRTGLLIVVIPNDDHLKELRAALPILGIEADKLDRTVQRFHDSLTLSSEHRLEYGSKLAAGDLADLLRMTPTYWHLGEAAATAAAGLGNVQVTMSFNILRFHKSTLEPVER